MGEAMWIISIISILFNFCQNLYNRCCPPKPYNYFPFKEIDLDQLASNLSSPLDTFPKYVQRNISYSLTDKRYILYGRQGVGKTREAFELIKKFNDSFGVEKIYLKNGYVDCPFSLPVNAEVRRVIVLIDDYDYGSATNLSWDSEDSNASLTMLENLSKIFNFFEKRVELLAFIVILNKDRIPYIFNNDDNRGFRIIDVSDITKEEYIHFLDLLIKNQSITCPDMIKIEFEKLYDARFSSIATCFNNYEEGKQLTEQDLNSYRTNLKEIWKMFRDRLSVKQKLIYEAMSILKKFSLTPLFEYVVELVYLQEPEINDAEIKIIVESLWAVKEGEIIYYSNQFSSSAPSRQDLEKMFQCISRIGNVLSRGPKRYCLQSDMLIFGRHIINSRDKVLVNAFLHMLNQWFPLDRFFAYQYAFFKFNNKQYLKAISILFRVLKKWNPLSYLSGKWIEIEIHLLLANIYIAMIGKRKINPIEKYKRIEFEYKKAIDLGKLAKDCDVDGFEFVGEWPGDNVRKDKKDEKIELENHLKELGYLHSRNLKLNHEKIRAMAHFDYAKYLTTEMHREYDAIEQNNIVIGLFPDCGDAFMLNAQMYLGIGDTIRAIRSLEEAEKRESYYFAKNVFLYFLAYYRWRTCLDIGQIQEAQNYLEKAMNLVDALIDVAGNIKRNLEHQASSDAISKMPVFLWKIRTKEFGNGLKYKILPCNLVFDFPVGWKIAEELCTINSLESFVVTFSPQIKIDEKTLSCFDASVTFQFLKRSKHDVETIEDFGEKYIKSLKLQWRICNNKRNIGCGSLLEWTHKSHSNRSFKGCLLAIERPDCRVLLQLMSQSFSYNHFKPFFDALIRDSLKQDFFQSDKIFIV